MGQWMMAQEISILQSLAVDGKCLRGSARTDGKPLQLLSAVSHRLRLTVAQDHPGKEQRNSCSQTVAAEAAPRGSGRQSHHRRDPVPAGVQPVFTQELGADYLWGLKGNQSGILERAQIRLPQRFPEYDTGWLKEHGRLVRWRIQRVSVSPRRSPACAVAGSSSPCGASARNCVPAK